MNWFFWLHCLCLTFSFFSFITFSLLLVLYNVSAAQLLGFPASPVFVFYLIFFCSSRSFWWFVFHHTFYVAARLVQCFILSNACPFDCVKSVHIRSYSGPYFPAFGLRMRENIDQNNSEYGHFLRSTCSHFANIH